MKPFVIKLMLIILFLCGLFYVDSYYPFVVVSICLLISVIAMPFFIMNEDWETNTWLVCISFWGVFGVYVYIGFHTEPWGDKVALVPPFYPIFGDVIAVGEKVDTLENIPENFISDEGKISTVRTTVFVLHLDSTTSLLFNSSRIILEKGRHILFKPRYYKYDWIETVSYLDDEDQPHCIDLLGHDIFAPGYFPYTMKIPVTPDFY